MTIRSIKVAFMFLFIAVNASSVAAESSPGVEEAAVVLRYPGEIALGQDDSRKLFRKSMEILQSSNFNSASPLWEWDEARINTEYGQAASGRHVLVTFAETKKVQTVGGYINVRELIIGLNGAQYASSVHTIDGKGKVIGHAKYAGQLCVELLDLVKEIAAKSPSSSIEPTR